MDLVNGLANDATEECGECKLIVAAEECGEPQIINNNKLTYC